jgi:diguanylate cyclase (GGDEF)-like protein
MRSIDYKKLPLSLVDDLTELCNRRFIYRNMPGIITQDKTASKKTALLMIDVDNFKKINDTLGHLTGDKVLVGLSKILKSCASEKGITARYAGDEFIILLPGQGESRAREVGEALLKGASSAKWPLEGKTFEGLGLSIGIAAYPEDSSSLEDLIGRADEALYAAKSAGKNTVIEYKSVGKRVKDHIRLKQAFLRPPLINRKDELDKVKKQFNLSQGGRNRALLVDGEFGIGKTRLLEEVAASAEKQKAFLLFCKLGRKGEGGPLAGLAEILRLVSNSFDLNKLGNILAKLNDEELSQILYTYPKFKNLLKNPPSAQKPQGRAEDLFMGVCKILAKVANGRTFVLAVDNLHYANRLTLEFFSMLFKTAKLEKLLFIGAYEKEDVEKELENFFTKGDFTVIIPGALTKNEILQFVDSIFPGIKLDQELTEKICGISKGNPLLLGEILKALVENGFIRYEGNAWQSRGAEIAKVPHSLQDAVEPRIGKLDDETREVLSHAAMMDGRIELEVLKEFSGRNEGELHELLDRASEAGLIKSSDLSHNSISFRSAMARQALADKVPAGEAQDLHKKLAEIIKKRYKDELPTQVNRLIRHFELAMDTSAAAKYKNINREVNKSFSLSKSFAGLLEKIEKEKDEPVSIDELMERPLSQASAKIIKDVIVAFRAAVIGALLYPVGNKMRVDLQNSTHETILKVLKNDPTLTFTDAEGKLLVNGTELKQIDAKSTIGFAFVSLMKDYSINSITFKEGLGKQEFAYFLYYIASTEGEIKKEGGISALLKKGKISHIKVDEVKYEKISKLKEKAIGAGATEKESIPQPEPGADLLNMPVEEYLNPKTANKLDLIAEALFLDKKNEKVEKIVNKLSGMLNTAPAGDKSDIAKWAIQVSKPLLAYEKFRLLETLTKALMARSYRTEDREEYAGLCAGLQTISNRLIDKENFGQAKTIIRHFKEQIASGSTCTEEKKKIAGREFQKIAHPKVAAALVDALRKKLDAANYKNIAEILADLGEYALDSMLKLLVEKEDLKKDSFDLYVMRHSIATILKKIGKPAKDALQAMLTDARPYVVKNSIEVLGYIGDKDMVAVIAPSLHAASHQVRMQCALSLKKIRTEESMESLVELLKDANENVRETASAAIAESADKSFKEKLTPLLQDASTKGIAKKTIEKIEAKKGK